MRASDEDRHRVIAALQEHTAAGRLTLDEFSERVGSVYEAVTLAELAVVTDGLPDLAPAPTDTARHLLIAFAIAVVTLLVLGLLMTLR